MSRLERKHQKVFAGSATNNGVFGSLQAETKQYSNDVETLQSLPAYDDGWNAATISSEKLPPLEEFQSLGYIDSYQLAYLFQEGCPEYNSSATYYKGSIVKVIGDNGNYTIYGCKVDDTTGVDPTNTANWFKVYDTVSGVQSVSNMEQELSQSTTTYPSSKAVYDAFSTISPDLYEKVANKAQDLSSPNETTYPSTQAVANETNNIVVEINTKPNYVDWGAGITVAVDASPFTAPDNGLFTYGGRVRTSGSPHNLSIDGSDNVDGSSCVAEYMSGFVPGKLVPVQKGQVITFEWMDGNKFFPYEIN